MSTCVHVKHRSWTTVRCHKPAKVYVDTTVILKPRYITDGKPADHGYCGVHDPVKVQARSDKTTARWRAEWAAKASEAKRTQTHKQLRDAVIAAALAWEPSRDSGDTTALANACVALKEFEAGR